MRHSLPAILLLAFSSLITAQTTEDWTRIPAGNHVDHMAFRGDTLWIAGQGTGLIARDEAAETTTVLLCPLSENPYDVLGMAVGKRSVFVHLFDGVFKYTAGRWSRLSEIWSYRAYLTRPDNWYDALKKSHGREMVAFGEDELFTHFDYKTGDYGLLSVWENESWRYINTQVSPIPASFDSARFASQIITGYNGDLVVSMGDSTTYRYQSGVWRIDPVSDLVGDQILSYHEVAPGKIYLIASGEEQVLLVENGAIIAHLGIGEVSENSLDFYRLHTTAAGKVLLLPESYEYPILELVEGQWKVFDLWLISTISKRPYHFRRPVNERLRLVAPFAVHPDREAVYLPKIWSVLAKVDQNGEILIPLNDRAMDVLYATEISHVDGGNVVATGDSYQPVVINNVGISTLYFPFSTTSLHGIRCTERNADERYVDYNGSVWLATSCSRVYRLAGGAFQKITTPYGDSIIRDSQLRLWRDTVFLTVNGSLTPGSGWYKWEHEDWVEVNAWPPASDAEEGVLDHNGVAWQWILGRPAYRIPSQAWRFVGPDSLPEFDANSYRGRPSTKNIYIDGNNTKYFVTQSHIYQITDQFLPKLRPTLKAFTFEEFGVPPPMRQLLIRADAIEGLWFIIDRKDLIHISCSGQQRYRARDLRYGLQARFWDVFATRDRIWVAAQGPGIYHFDRSSEIPPCAYDLPEQEPFLNVGRNAAGDILLAHSPDRTDPIDVIVYDLTGRVLLRTALPAQAAPQRVPLDVSSLGAGVYLLRLQQGDAVVNRKIWVE